MGGRGKGSAGAAANPLLHTASGVRLTPQEIAKQLGFKSIAEMEKAAELRDFVAQNSDSAKVMKNLSEHRGMGGLGPIMLRIGLPRNKLLDIVHALKPLRDHGILSLTMPFSYKGYEDPFKLAESSVANEAGALNALEQSTLSALDSRVWLKKIKNAPFDILNIPKNKNG